MKTAWPNQSFNADAGGASPAAAGRRLTCVVRPRTMRFELQTLVDYSDDSLLAELRRVAEALKGQRLTRDRFDTISRVHSSTLDNHFGSWRAALDRAGISESVAPRRKLVSRADVISAIRAHASENGGFAPTLADVAQRLAIDRNGLTRKFGKWDLLLSEVGLRPVPLGRRYSDEECYENLLSLWTHYGRQPRFAELNQPPSRVGSKAYVRRWGGWRAALNAFVRAANDAEAPANPLIPTRSDNNSTTVPLPTAPGPRSMSLSLRYKVLLRDRFRCVACGRSPAKDGDVELHVDHIVPWSRGGLNIESNLRTLCARCNLGKGARLDEA